MDKQKLIEDNDSRMRATINVINNVLARQRRTKDPVIKYSMFLDKICLSIDILLGLLNSIEVSPDVKSEMESSSKELQNEICSLLDWIQQPIYSPDHLYGSVLAKEAECNFQQVNNS